MRSTAHFKTHPVHPILIPFPLAFFTGTFLSHLASVLLEKPSLDETTFYLNGAGIFFAVLAAIPGLIDLLKTVPPESSAKKRGVQHGLLNSAVLILYIIAWVVRRNHTSDPAWLFGLEIPALILMSIAGWMGGTLVYRNQIGVDHRYAHAGKWNEASLQPGNGWLEAAGENELKINAMKLLHIGNKRIVLARTENNFTAFADRCPHKGGSLADGSIACGIVQCPWHGSQFDTANGQCTAGPSTHGIQTYPVMQKEGKVYIQFREK